MIVANKFKIKSILIFDQLFGKSNFTSKLKAWLSINQNMIICRHAVVSRIKSRVSASNWLLKRFKKITYTGKNNGFPFLDILGYLKNTHKNPKFGKVRQVPTREFPTKFPDWDLSHSSKFGIFVGIL